DAQGTCYTPPRSTGVLGSCFSTDRLAVPTWGGRAACGPHVLLLAQGSVRRTSSFGTAFWQARLAARTTAATPGRANGGGGADRAISLRIWTLSSRRLP